MGLSSSNVSSDALSFFLARGLRILLPSYRCNLLGSGPPRIQVRTCASSVRMLSTLHLTRLHARTRNALVRGPSKAHIYRMSRIFPRESIG